MNSQTDWATAASQVQQTLANGWTQALETLQSMGAPAAGQVPFQAPLTSNTEKLQQLQSAYLSEAAELWNKGLTPPADKRFAANAWAQNPVSAFSATRPRMISSIRACSARRFAGSRKLPITRYSTTPTPGRTTMSRIHAIAAVGLRPRGITMRAVITIAACTSAASDQVRLARKPESTG